MNTYLKALHIPSRDIEFNWLNRYDPERKASQVKVYSSHYPFGFFTRFFECPKFEFEPITIFYGGNGSGKSTILNVISEILLLTRNSPFNKTDFFDDYCNLCNIESGIIPAESKIITSDDIFRKMSSVRSINNSINDLRGTVRSKQKKLRDESRSNHEVFRLNGMDDYNRWNEYVEATGKSTSSYISERVEKNLKAGSNGETAMKYLTEEIEQDALYLLDEPENSLAPKLQLELKTFLEESARFFNCQLIIATHSPLLLGMNGAKIYNLDDDYADSCKWTELENVKVYADFFREHMSEFY